MTRQASITWMTQQNRKCQRQEVGFLGTAQRRHRTRELTDQLVQNVQLTYYCSSVTVLNTMKMNDYNTEENTIHSCVLHPKYVPFMVVSVNTELHGCGGRSQDRHISALRRTDHG